MCNQIKLDLFTDAASLIAIKLDLFTDAASLIAHNQT
jgi:hypothetical protein